MGEVREADMPTALIEVGFHTNTLDSAALRNSTFRAAAMKGVEKGYRLNAAGKTTCEPFKISSIPDATGPHLVNIPVDINYAGYPQFPVKLKSGNNDLSTWPSYAAAARKLYASAIPSPLRYTWACNTTVTSSRTFRLRATLTDVDGVTTNSVEHNVTCTPPAQPALLFCLSASHGKCGLAQATVSLLYRALPRFPPRRFLSARDSGG